MKKFLLSGVALTALLGGAASAADLAFRPPPPPAPVWTWTGFYIGANAGGTWSSNNSVTTTSLPTSDFFLDPTGASFAANSALGASGGAPLGNGNAFIGGVQLGYNWQFGAGLAGIEADIQGVGNRSGSNLGTLTTVVGPFPFFGPGELITTSIASSKQVNSLGTVRGRLGFLAMPALLFYGTGGFAYGSVKASTAITQSNNDCVLFPGTCIQTTATTAGSFSQTRAGWSAGAGAEWLFAPNWSAKLEYLYYDLGNVTFGNGALVFTSGSFPGAGGPAVIASQSTTRFNGNIVRVGLNYKFGSPGYYGGHGYGAYRAY